MIGGNLFDTINPKWRVYWGKGFITRCHACYEPHNPVVSFCLKILLMFISRSMLDLSEQGLMVYGTPSVLNYTFFVLGASH